MRHLQREPLSQGDPLRRASVPSRQLPFGIGVALLLAAGPTLHGQPSMARAATEIQNAEAQRLESALARYRQIGTRDDWGVIPDGPTLREGDTNARVSHLRRRLAFEDGGAATESLQFDASLAGAVRHFQERHGLEVDGVVGKHTLAALNVSVAQRIRQLELNLQRLLAQVQPKPVPRIEVNIAEQMLRYYGTNGDVMMMRTIVGRRDWQTPVFEAELVAVTFAPYWNVPARIAALEVLPAIRRDPAYIRRNDMEVVTVGTPARTVDPSAIDWSRVSTSTFPYRIRQRPGPQNPLGDVKFLLPNPYDVYLHDTPGKAAFARSSRALSHGCIRLERALDLARALLSGDPVAHPDSLSGIIHARRERTVRLHRSVPVMIRYITAWVDADGTVQFRDDIYGHDRRGASPSKPSVSSESECAAQAS